MRTIHEIEELRDRHSITKAELCRRANVDSDTYWRGLSGQSGTTVTKLESLNTALDQLIAETAHVGR